jgi:hypothetical protein
MIARASAERSEARRPWFNDISNVALKGRDTVSQIVFGSVAWIKQEYFIATIMLFQGLGRTCGLIQGRRASPCSALAPGYLIAFGAPVTSSSKLSIHK